MNFITLNALSSKSEKMEEEKKTNKYIAYTSYYQIIRTVGVTKLVMLISNTKSKNKKRNREYLCNLIRAFLIFKNASFQIEFYTLSSGMG